MSTVKVDTLTNTLGTKSIPVDNVVDGQCAAWCRAFAIGSAIDAGFNFASVTYLGLGVVEFIMTTPMADANYSVVATANRDSGDGAAIVQELRTGLFARTTTTFRLLMTYDTGTAGAAVPSATSHLNVAVFGNK